MEKKELDDKMNKAGINSLNEEESVYYSKLDKKLGKRKMKNRVDYVKKEQIPVAWSPKVKVCYAVHIVKVVKMTKQMPKKV